MYFCNFCLFLSLGREGKSHYVLWSMLTVEQVRTDKPGITWISSHAHSWYLCFLSLSSLAVPPPQLFLYFNGSEALTGCDCLIDRQIDISRWRRVHGRREQGAEDEVCVLSSTGTRSSVCLWRMMDYKGASGLCACVCVCMWDVGMGPFIAWLCTQWKYGSELISAAGKGH